MFVHRRFIINTFAHLRDLVIIINLIHCTKRFVVTSNCFFDTKSKKKCKLEYGISV